MMRHVAAPETMRSVVTGGTSGIGAAIVERLRSQGAAVVFTGRDSVRGLDVETRTGASFVRADVRDPEDVRASVQAAVEILGGVDALVLNAGVLHDAPLSETTDQAWDAVLLVRYPSRAAFSAMVADPEYHQVTELRTRALREAVLQATTPW